MLRTQFLQSTVVEMIRDSIFRHKIKNYGNRVTPWRMPLVGWKNCVGVPLIEMEEVVTQVIIR